MTFRRRIVVLAAGAVAAAIALAAVVTFVVVRHELRAGVDASLHELRPKVVFVSRTAGGCGRVAGKEAGKTTVGPGDIFQAQLPPTAFGGSAGVVQATLPNGDVIRSATGPPLPDDRPRCARSPPARSASRCATRPSAACTRACSRRAGRTARRCRSPSRSPRSTTRSGGCAGSCSRVTVGGVGVAAGLGVGVSRAATRPLGRLTAAAEQVTATGDLHHRIEPIADDEPGRLAAAFNAMLGALEASRDAQRQLVADASHELRTPLTSIRANVELLERARTTCRRPSARRPRLGARASSRTSRSSSAISSISRAPANARSSRPRTCGSTSSCSDAVRARAPPRARDRVRRSRAEPCMVSGSRARLARAVGNLLDNAVKWSPPGQPVEVAVAAGEVTVRDHGPGIAEDDLPHVFDRFYRAPAARGLPGSGLGPGDRQARRRRARRQRRRRGRRPAAARGCA